MVVSTAPARLSGSARVRSIDRPGRALHRTQFYDEPRRRRPLDITLPVCLGSLRCTAAHDEIKKYIIISLPCTVVGLYHARNSDSHRPLSASPCYVYLSVCTRICCPALELSWGPKRAHSPHPHRAHTHPHRAARPQFTNSLATPGSRSVASGELV